MREIDLVKVLQNLVKHFWLPMLLALIGAAGMFFLSGEIDTWNLHTGYSVVAMSRDESNSDFYFYEESLAEAVYWQLERDEEIAKLKTTAEYFWIQQNNRRIEVIAKAEGKEFFTQAKELFDAKAEEYLWTEAGTTAMLKVEYFDLQKEQAHKGKWILFGGIFGLCIGLSVLLVVEYINSPKMIKRIESAA